MQRAISFSKQVSSHHLAQNCEVEIEKLTHLLPQSVHTQVCVDLYQMLAHSKSRVWTLPLTPTLLSDFSGLTVVSNNEKMEVVAKKCRSEEAAFQLFSKEVGKWEEKTRWPWPKYVHRTDDKRPNFLSDFETAVGVWRSTASEDQQLQMYILPATTQMTLLRAHWKAAKKRAVYYIVSNRKPAEVKTDLKLPFLARRLPELIQTRASLLPVSVGFSYGVNVKSPSECWAVKRTKPISEVNKALLQVAKLIEFSPAHSREKVQELVCDFVPNQQKKWVLLGCKGVYFSSHSKSITQNYELKRKIDLKFILFPLFHQKQILGQRLREAKKNAEEPLLSTHARRISILGLTDKPKTEEPTANPSPEPRDIELLDSPSFRFASKSPSKGYSFNQVISDYDEMMGNIKRYKMELRGATNYIERYGGCEFWSPIMSHVMERLAEEPTLNRLLSDISQEECRMMRRGLERVLEGNYNMYYKQSLALIHKSMGVTEEMFVLFTNLIEQVIGRIAISPHDCGIIMRRFVMLEGCIVGSEGTT